MLLLVTPWEDPGPTSPTHHPTAPKPSKDNARLSRLLRKAARGVGCSNLLRNLQKSFRSTLPPLEVTPPSSAQEPLSLPTKETSLLKTLKTKTSKKEAGGGWARLVKHLM
ncbi:hypothetical protein GDO86_008738 [Hymenochirus boettgeri]|uniref:Uncharacterized protein n=1 Tax=Hymenochirus boettgeri TaxID=247094 RepID=A0A8T2J460_9PIPI|nr:hypothetical protein GDO86_008738 [Hymenochirus boettgeri]